MPTFNFSNPSTSNLRFLDQFPDSNPYFENSNDHFFKSDEKNICRLWYVYTIQIHTSNKHGPSFSEIHWNQISDFWQIPSHNFEITLFDMSATVIFRNPTVWIFQIIQRRSSLESIFSKFQRPSFLEIQWHQICSFWEHFEDSNP